MGMRSASRMKTNVNLVVGFTALSSLIVTVASIIMAYKAIEHAFDVKDAFLAIFGLLLVISVNS